VRSWEFLSLYWSGSSALEASWEARHTFWICVAPLRLGGLRGKQSTPSDLAGRYRCSLYGRRAGAARSSTITSAFGGR
jgi:hypothetical protein